MAVERNIATSSGNNGREVASDAVDYALKQVLRAERLTPALAATVPSGLIPGHDILEEVHRGGQGVVYKARRKSTGRLVAIKILRWGGVAGPNEHVRFEREIKALASLHHPYIVSLHDGGIVGEYRYFVMDYIEGSSLVEYVRQAKPPMPDRLRLFLRICRAIEAAHQRGIIHRDLKPNNVILNRNGEPHVVDFGLAKLIKGDEPGASMETITEAGHFLGSLPWAAPEQADGKSHAIDTRTDVYGLGALLYALLTEHPPFAMEGSTRRIIDAICNASPVSPRSIVPALDRDLETIALKCLSKEPERRYATVHDVARDVERFVAGAPISARQDSRWYVLRRSLRRHRAAAAVMGILVLSTVFYAITMTVMFRRAKTAEASSQRQFGIASGALDFLIEQVSDELVEVVGKRNLRGNILDARRNILAGAQAHLSQLAEVQGDAPEIRRGRAGAQTKLGDIAVSLGDMESAEGHFRKALQERELVASCDAATDDDRVELSLALVRVGDTYKERGLFEIARGFYEDAFEIDLQLLGKDPERTRFLNNLLWSHERLGHLAKKRREFRLAEEHIRQQLEIAERLVVIAPTPNHRWAKATALGKLQEIARYGGDELLAYQLNTECLAVLEELVAEVPNELRFARSLVAALSTQSMLAAGIGDTDRVLQYDERGVKLARNLIAEAPDHLGIRSTLIHALVGLAGRLSEDPRNDLARAVSLFQEAQRNTEDLLRRAPERKSYWRERALILYYKAKLYSRMGERDKAEACYQELFEVAAEILERGFDTPGFWNVWSYALASALPTELRDTAAAADAARRYVEAFGYESPRALIVLADALAANGDIAEARATLERAQSLASPNSTSLVSSIDRRLEALKESP